MIIKKEVVNLIEKSIGKNKIESGGILGGVGETITQFSYDRACSENEYIPDIINLNKVIKSWWNNGICFKGIVHSHKCNTKLSFADIEYALDIIKHNDLKCVYMLLYVIMERSFYAYTIKNDSIIKDNIKII